MYLLYVHTIYFGYSWANQSYEIFVFCLSVKQYGRNPVAQSHCFGILKPAHYFRSKCLREDYRYISSQVFQASPAQLQRIQRRPSVVCFCHRWLHSNQFVDWASSIPLVCSAKACLLELILYIYSDPRFQILRSQGFQMPINTCCVLPLWQISA